MQGWQTPYLGLRDIPHEFTEFELEAFFGFSRELEQIERLGGGAATVSGWAWRCTSASCA